MTSLQLNTHCLQWDGTNVNKKIYYRTSSEVDSAVLYEEQPVGWLASCGLKQPYRVTTQDSWGMRQLGHLRSISQSMMEYVLPILLVADRGGDTIEYVLAGSVTVFWMGYAAIAGPLALIVEVASMVLLAKVLLGKVVETMLQFDWKLGKQESYWPLATALPHLALGIIAWFPVVLASSSAAALTAHLLLKAGCTSHQEQDVVRHMRNPKIRNLLTAYVVLGAPLVEEVVFRGVLQDWLNSEAQVKPTTWVQQVRKKWDKLFGKEEKPSSRLSSAQWKTACKVAVVFGLAHMSLGYGWLNVPLFVAITIAGLAMSVLRETTGDLWAPFGMHCLHNTFSMFQVYQKIPV